jgi:hypothetical protein
MSNLGHFTSEEIYAMIVSSYPKKASEISVVEVMRWCGELTTTILKSPTGYVMNNKVRMGFGPNKEVRDSRVPAPRFIYKLEGVYDENKRLVKDYSYQGGYIYFPKNLTPQIVYIDYLSVPVDDNGFPLIKRGYEQAAYAYCVYKMFEEDSSSIPPRVAQWKWIEITQTKDWEIEAAMRSWEDINNNDIEEVHRYMVAPEYAHVYGNKGNKRVLDASYTINHNSNIE